MSEIAAGARGLRKLYRLGTEERYGVLWDTLRNAAPWGLLALVAYAVARSMVYAAVGKPFWFDEVLTQVICRQGSFSAMWGALKRGVDGNPPAFSLVERSVAWFIPNEHVGYRLLSVIGFAATLHLVYVFVKTRNGGPRALLCSALLLITPLFTLYAEEARPYSLVTACIALALVCYQRAPAAPWVIGLCLSLILAALVHYYAVLVFLPFFPAELTVVYQTKRVRFGVWAALLVAVVPTGISWPVLMWMKQNWGPHFWARNAALNQVSATYAAFFRIESPWGTAVVGLAILMLAAGLVRRTLPTDATEGMPKAPAAERVLILGLVALPMIGYLVAKITHGPYVERYFLPTILGIAASVGYALGQVKRESALVAAVFVGLAIGSQEFGFWRMLGHWQRPADIVAPVANLAGITRYADLPIVVSDVGVYVEFWHYAPPELLRRVVTLPDPENAVNYSGTDTVDKLVIALKSCEPIAVEDLAHFEAEHQTFLLYSNGSRIDWLPARLAHDGNQLRLLDRQLGGSAYLVELKAPVRGTD